jgi:succinate-acetate transporter protein
VAEQVQWGNPHVATPWIVGVTCFGLCGWLTGVVPGSGRVPWELTVVSEWGIQYQITVFAVIAPLILAAVIGTIFGVVHLKRGETLPGILAIIFGSIIGGLWSLLFLLKLIIPYFGPHGVVSVGPLAGTGATYPLLAGNPSMEGWLWLAVSLFLVILAIALGRVSWQPCFMIFFSAVIFFLIALWSFAGAPDPLTSGLSQAAGWMLLLFGLWIIYFGAVGLINEAFARPILPMGGPIFK